MRRHTWVGIGGFIVAFWPALNARASERVIRTIDAADWTSVARAVARDTLGPSKGGVVPPPEFRDLKLVGTSNHGLTIVAQTRPAAAPLTIPLLSIESPAVTADDYAVVGRVAYAGVDPASDMDGVGYLELWSEFPGGGRYFTRTLSDTGPTQALAGRSAARPFRLPFCANPGQRPLRLEVNLVLPGKATVTLSDLKLVQDEDPAAIANVAATSTVPPPWWARDGVINCGIGLFGLIGFLGLSEPLIRRGRGYRVVVSAVVGVGLVGQVYFGWAMALVGRGDGWRDWGPLLLCAVAAWCVPLSIPRLNRRYRDAELRRMRAMDAVAV
jgi:hypothetical protein